MVLPHSIRVHRCRYVPNQVWGTYYMRLTSRRFPQRWMLHHTETYLPLAAPGCRCSAVQIQQENNILHQMQYYIQMGRCCWKRGIYCPLYEQKAGSDGQPWWFGEPPALRCLQIHDSAMRWRSPLVTGCLDQALSGLQSLCNHLKSHFSVFWRFPTRNNRCRIAEQRNWAVIPAMW